MQDYEATVDFYIDALGFEVEERSERSAMLRAGTFRLLLHVGGPPSAPADLAMHLHLDVDDVDGYHRHLVERGVNVSGPPQDQPWGLRTFDIHDPNGYEWEFTQAIAAAPDE